MVFERNEIFRFLYQTNYINNYSFDFDSCHNHVYVIKVHNIFKKNIRNY